MTKEEYFIDLKKYIDRLDADLKVEDELYEKRLSYCKQCEQLTDAMCQACGCFVELRAVKKDLSCPYDKW